MVISLFLPNNIKQLNNDEIKIIERIIENPTDYQTEIIDFDEQSFVLLLLNYTLNSFDVKNYIFKNEDDNLNDSCCICLEKFKENEQLKKLKCNHVFHKNCMINWFIEKMECPICRNNISV